MNLRVDLILPSEARSASVFTPKLILRIVSFVAPAIILAVTAAAVLRVMDMATKADALERRWLQAEPKQQHAIELAGKLNANKKIRDELEGWRQSQVNWHSQIAALPKMTPRTVQLLDLNADQVLETMEKEQTLARAFTMQIRGRAVGKGSDLAVDEFEQHLRTFADFAPLMENVEVIAFGADTTKGASEDDRLFTIRCKYLPRPF
jgi:hypothetical protein